MALYFAYGSNLDQAQMANRCPSSSPVSAGWLRGYALGFTAYSVVWGGGVADILPKQDSLVWGLVYELSESDLGELDACEGWPDKYNRRLAAMETPGGPLEGWVYYVVNPDDFIPPSPEYLGVIIEAAVELQFPADYVIGLRSIRTSAEG